MEIEKIKTKARGVAGATVLMFAGLGVEHVADRIVGRQNTLKVESTAVTLVDPAQAAMVESEPRKRTAK